jgi:hypothetical protein
MVRLLLAPRRHDVVRPAPASSRIERPPAMDGTLKESEMVLKA